jgi:hypothetical protein
MTARSLWLNLQHINCSALVFVPNEVFISFYITIFCYNIHRTTFQASYFGACPHVWYLKGCIGGLLFN